MLSSRKLFEGVARIERQAYETLTALVQSRPTRVLTAGGAANQRVWQRIRSRSSVSPSPVPNGTRRRSERPVLH